MDKRLINELTRQLVNSPTGQPFYPPPYHLIKLKSSQSSKQKSHSLCALAAYFLSLHIGNGTHALQLIACARMQNGGENGETH